MPDQLSFIACTDSYEHLTCKMLAIMTWVSKLKTKTKVQFLKQCHTLFILPLFICSRIFSALSYYSRVCGWKVNNTRGLSYKWHYPLRGEGESAKRWRYYINLYSKMSDKGEGGAKDLKKWVTSFMMDSPFP